MTSGDRTTRELHNVSMRYRRVDAESVGPEVISNLSLRTRAGEWVAIVGESGVGQENIYDLLTLATRICAECLNENGNA